MMAKYDLSSYVGFSVFDSHLNETRKTYGVIVLQPTAYYRSSYLIRELKHLRKDSKYSSLYFDIEETEIFSLDDELLAVLTLGDFF